MNIYCNARQKTNIFKKCNRKSIKNTKYCKYHNDNINTTKDYNKPLYNYKTILNAFHTFNKKTNDTELMKYCLYIYNKDYSGSKNIVYEKFKLLQTYLLYYLNNLDKIIKVQSIFRKKLIQNINKKKGIHHILYEKTSIVNDSDFYTCENINNIKYNYFFSYKDIDNFIYVFDIRSINLLLKSDNKNPYNRNIIPNNIQNNIKYLINNSNEIYNFDKCILTESQLLNQNVLEIFQKIDQFYYTDINWFLDLTVHKLKKFYTLLEDIWNWRAELTYDIKFQIIGNNTIFQNINYITTSNNKTKIQKIILNDINILVSSGETREYQGLGALYTLVALTYVSDGCATSMPWLYDVLF
jgi:hypothetical protein